MNDPAPDANDPAPQSALRELRDHFSHPGTLAGLAGVAGLMALAGPFDTDTLLRLGPRAVYWAAMVGATYATGYLAGHLVAPRLPRHWPGLATALVTGLATGAGIVPVVLAINLATFGWLPDASEWPGFVGTLVAMAVLVTLTIQTLETQLRRALAPAAPHTPGPEEPALLSRLPPAKRGPLVALSVEDHYTRVRTTRGEELLLLRLTDAIREAAPVRGVQVHRSHWVALDRVTAARREGDRAVLSLTHGPDVPVSRANVPAIRAAGLLP